jgi:hypothetical protein
MSEVKIKCKKCGRRLSQKSFFTFRNGEKSELCKKCLTMHVDNFDESTFLWLLEKFDVPYIPSEWNILRDKAFNQDPEGMNGTSVLGRYLSKMKLKQWEDYRWADTDELNGYVQERKQKEKEEEEKFEEEIEKQYREGIISEAQYKTLLSTETQARNISSFVKQTSNPPPSETGFFNFYDENDYINEDEMADPAEQLTKDDKVYLAMKWGRLYKPNEWIELEKSYNEMMSSFDIQDADTLNSLKLLCKTNLKMNQAIDEGNLEDYQKLSKVSEGLRKSSKFTAAQNKQEKGEYVDSVGELVAICEKEGFIPRYPTDIPQDKIDLTLKDMNKYLYKLVTQDLGFGQQIETALRKIQNQKEMEEAESDNLEEEIQDYSVIDEDSISEQYFEMLDELKADNAEKEAEVAEKFEIEEIVAKAKKERSKRIKDKKAESAKKKNKYAEMSEEEFNEYLKTLQ